MTDGRTAFRGLRAALEQAGIRFAVGGSWASAAHGDARFTQDVDILADLTPDTLSRFLAALPDTYIVEPEEALRALALNRPFNVIYVPEVFKFDFFPAHAFPLGAQELERAVYLTGTGLCDDDAPFVTPEDILLAKLHWFKAGGEVSELQWRDILGVLRTCSAKLDHAYLEQNAPILGVTELLNKALTEA